MRKKRGDGKRQPDREDWETQRGADRKTQFCRGNGGGSPKTTLSERGSGSSKNFSSTGSGRRRPSKGGEPVGKKGGKGGRKKGKGALKPGGKKGGKKGGGAMKPEGEKPRGGERGGMGGPSMAKTLLGPGGAKSLLLLLLCSRTPNAAGSEVATCQSRSRKRPGHRISCKHGFRHKLSQTGPDRENRADLLSGNRLG